MYEFKDVSGKTIRTGDTVEWFRSKYKVAALSASGNQPYDMATLKEIGSGRTIEKPTHELTLANARAANAKFKVGDKVAVLLSTQYLEYPVAEVFDGLGNVWYTLRGYGDVKERDVASPALWKYKDGTRVKTKDGKNGMVIGRAWDFYYKEPSYEVKFDEGGASSFCSQRFLRLANARICNSTNPVVRKALNSVATNAKDANGKEIKVGSLVRPKTMRPGTEEVVKSIEGDKVWYTSTYGNVWEYAKNLIVANARACNGKWVVLYRDGGKEKIDAPSHAEAKKIADDKSKKSGRGYISVIVDDGVDYGINAATNATEWEKVYQIKGLPVKLVWRGEPFNDLKATVEGGNRTYVPVARIIASNPVSQTEAEKLCAAKWRQIKAIANAVKTTNAVVAKALDAVAKNAWMPIGSTSVSSAKDSDGRPIKVGDIVTKTSGSWTEDEVVAVFKDANGKVGITLKGSPRLVRDPATEIVKNKDAVRNSVYDTESELERALGAKLGKDIDVGIQGSAVSISLASKDDIDKALAVVKGKLGAVASYKFVDGALPYLAVALKAPVANSEATGKPVAENADSDWIEKFEVGGVYHGPYMNKDWLAKVLSRTDSSIRVAIKSRRDKTWHGKDEQVTLRIDKGLAESDGIEVAKGYGWEFWANDYE